MLIDNQMWLFLKIIQYMVKSRLCAAVLYVFINSCGYVRREKEEMWSKVEVDGKDDGFVTWRLWIAALLSEFVHLN